MSDLITVCSALVVGASLAASGATLQSALRNPLAEPFMLGTVGGAALFTALALHLGFAAGGAFVLPLAAFLGACFSLALVCGIAWVSARRRGGEAFSGETVILAGFVTGSFTGSLQMVVLSSAAPETHVLLSKWLFGNLHAVRGPALTCAAGCAVVAFAALYSRVRALNALMLGATVARSLGVNVRKTYLVVFGAASLATAASVALAGAIGFLGLVVPHVARRIFGVNHRVYLPASALMGGVVLLGADMAGRLFPGEISAGVVCAVCGSPFFLYLLCLRRRPC